MGLTADQKLQKIIELEGNIHCPNESGGGGERTESQ